MPEQALAWSYSLTEAISNVLQQLGALTSCWGMQEMPQQLDRAAQRALLEKRVAGMPFAMPEIVRHTRDEDLYFSVIADRCGALTATHCAAPDTPKETRPLSSGSIYCPASGETS